MKRLEGRRNGWEKRALMEISSDFVMDPQESKCPLIEGRALGKVNPIVPTPGAGDIRDFEQHRALVCLSWVVEAGLSSFAYLY